jgi:hypothetical protein
MRLYELTTPLRMASEENKIRQLILVADTLGQGPPYGLSLLFR